MSERKRKRGRPRTVPVISYGAEMRMRNNIPRNIKKPKYLLDAEEESIQSRGSTPCRNLDERGSVIKNSRGYNPDFDDRNSEFHYGSDFEEAGSENEAVDSDTPNFSDLGLLSDDEGVLSDNYSREHDGQGTPRDVMSPAPGRAATPDAVWLQDRNIPELNLPPSANDLLIPTCYFMPVLGIYEVFRHFRTLVRLSPFRFEEFCGALLNPQQTVLLAEMHIALLRALIREDESQSTHFGPMDHKDSINIMLYLVDPLTWPQVLNNYLQSDLKSYHSIVKMMETCSYPYTSLQNRLQVLRALTDEVLCVSGVREELISEGKLRYDDHCRACHKTGDLLCCDSCTAVFHIDCLEKGPPPDPLDDWTCSICRKHQVSGVTDCLSSPELSGMLCRHDPLGYDRHGRKYWFLARRLIVESNSGEVRYYSSRRQVQAVLSRLDAVDLERDLVACIDDLIHEIERQQAITEQLWDEKRGTRPSALHADDEVIMKFTDESKDEVKDEVKAEVKDEFSEPKDGQPNDDEVKVEVKEEPLDDVKAEEGSPADDAVKIEELEGGDQQKGTGKWDLWGASIVGRSWLLPLETVQQVVNEKLDQLKSTDKDYRLGSESGCSYTNEYSSNPLALNKLQHNEDRDKKRHLSHKFSVACSSQEFKWSGTLYGSDQDLRECLRAGLQQTEQQLSSHLYHPHWTAMRKTWLTAVASSSTPRHFARCLLWLVAAIKPVVFHNVWHEALGHVRLTRVTALEREEKRRQEKRDKKDQETQQMDDYRNTLPVRFTKMPKHQLWKVKGEEYRAVCGDGWRWWARHRRPRDVPASSVGLRAGPDKMMVGVHMTGGLRGLPVAPDVFTRLAAKTPGLLPSLYSPNQRRKMGLDGSHDSAEESANDRNEIIISNAGTDGLTQKVEVMVTPLEQFFEDGLVNVSRSLVGRTRLVYPKVPAPSQFLDGLLARRVALPTVGSKGGEESADMDVDGETCVGEEGSGGAGVGEAGAVDATIQVIPDSQRSATHRLRPAGNLLKEIRQHKLRYEALDESVFHYRCYSPSCTGGTSTCYSPLCRAKTKTREKLLNAVKNYTIVTSKPSPYPEIGVNDVIKVSEMDFSEDSKKGSSGDGRPSTPTGGVVGRSGSVPSTPSKGVMQQHSAGHIIGSSVELPRSASGEETGNADRTGQISVRLDQDLDENSQSSDALEHKFALKAEKVAAATTSCCGKVYLKRKQMAKLKKTVLRLPQISRCRVGRDRYSLLVLPQHELRTAARRSWRHTVSGYHHLSKSNASVWPYPCPRPLFRLTWLYRTAALTSLSGAALQLRLLWSCLRWDDMHEKGPSDGKRHITTDAEIIQTEILKRKYSGRFSEKTEYLRRKVTIPFEVPKPIREFTPSQRSGLRKRRRAQSPEDKRPESVEEWIPEEQLLLWEIRLFGERLERAANQPKKDALSASSSPALKITLSGNNAGSTELKQRLEEQLKQQRAAFQQQQREGGRTLLKIASLPSGVSKPVTSLVAPTKAQALNTVNSPTKKLMRTKDGRLISVQTLGSIQPASSVGNSTIFPMAGSLPKVQIASQPGNKVIRLQTVPANPRMILPRAPRPLLQQAAPPTIRLPNQNIQILRMPDGQIQVKGLLDGQQMIQRPDGKFQLINTSAVTLASPANTLNKAVGATIGVGGVQVTQQKTIKPLLPQQQQILKVNGQQVLLRKDGMNTQIVSVGTGEALKAAGVIVNSPQLQQQASNVISVNPPQGKTVITSQGIAKTVVLQPQQGVGAASPVVSSNTAPKTEGSSLTLRVQVRMTEQGPKTIIQGLQPSVGLTKDHIRAIQQQVRSMLAQYNLKVNQLSPIMTLTLHIGNQAQQVPQQHPQTIQVSAAQTANQSKDGNILMQPAAQQQQLIQVQGSSSESSLQSPGIKLPTVIALKNNASGTTGPATYIRTSSGALIPAVNTSSNQSAVNGAGGIPGQEAASPNAKTDPSGGSQFVLTNDYIQQTIQSALNCNDLSPDVEEKLVQLRKYNTEQGTTVPTLPSLVLPTVSKRSREQSESGSRNTKKARTSSSSSSAAAAGGEESQLAVPAALGSPRARESCDGRPGDAASPQPTVKKGRRASPLDDAKRKQALLAKLEGQLSKHKELLKKDILKKRAILEKDLQLQIHKELGVAKQHIHAIENKGGSSTTKTDSPAAKKRKRHESASEGSPARPPPAPCPPSLTTAGARLSATSPPPTQNNKKITTNHKLTINSKKTKNKNKKIVCICRTPFDDTKFYVGCDLCANWFHGDCVGITEALSRTMTEYVCDDCANAKLNKELYCFCRQPYDETQFYICCEQCDDWYHGRCIGIMQGEADDIDDYICPKCEPSNIWNHACQKKLTNKDYTELKKVAKTLVSHKNAWPFLEAVDPGEVPEYYKVVREPMDLRTVERRVRDHHYTRLQGFIGDVMLLLDNCRLFNPPNSSFVSCAATIESFFCSKVKLLKQKIMSQSGH